MTAVVCQYSTEHQRGLVLGTLRSLGSLARVVGPVLASGLFWLFGPEVCYVVGAVGLVVPVVLLEVLVAVRQSVRA